LEFLETPYHYLILLLGSVAFPLAFSFESRMKFYRKWKALFKGIFVMMLLFIPWDIWFTDIGVWSFNDDYVTGLKIWLLPIEEWLFFILIPYACLFIHSSLKYYLKGDIFSKWARPIFAVMVVLLLLIAVFNTHNYYTAVVSSLTCLSLLFLVYKNPNWIGRFLMTYLVCWIPFLLVNGALTGSFTENPVVSYNPSEFMGIRIGSIPVEDSIYNLLMLLMVTYFYEETP